MSQSIQSVILPTALDLESGNLEKEINNLIESNPLLVFSKSTCPFCLGKFMNDEIS